MPTRKITLQNRQHDAAALPGDRDGSAPRGISHELRHLLAGIFALKIENFHWRMSGTRSHGRDLLLDEQGDQLFAADPQNRPDHAAFDQRYRRLQ